MTFNLEIHNRGIILVEGHGKWLIGRAQGSDIHFPDDAYCPRQAANLIVNDEGAFLEPLSASSPIYIDAVAIKQTTRLKNGHVIQFGEQTIVISGLEDVGGEKSISQTFTAPASDEAQATLSASVAVDMQALSGGAIAFSNPPTVIGRNPGQGVKLSHPAVSRTHAEIGLRGQDRYVKDLGSTNGTFINGRRISGTETVRDGDDISIGPFSYQVSGQAMAPVEFDSAAPILDATNLTVDVKNRADGTPLRILDNVSVSIKKGSFVCIVGSSGSGKSTLMNLLAARTLPSGGTVMMKGANLAANFAALKHEIAYVPQNNILHEALSLRQALSYAARLRLPPDLSSKARNNVINDAAEAVDLGERLDIKIKDLSGGQKKRASLASETLSSPEVLFLDEVTSGLDEATDREIMSLMRKRADSGMTVVCVTHTLANVQSFCDTLIVMGRGGIPAYIGAPRDAPAFFQVETLSEIFDRLDEHGPQYWRDRGEVELPAMQPKQGVSAETNVSEISGTSKNANAFRQLGILVDRSTRLTLADTKNLIMALIQSVMIGSMLGYAYSEFGDAGQEISSRIALLMALGTSALWLGTTTASSDIVSESQIFQRERDVNVSTIAFVLSKFTVSGVFTMMQVTLVFFLAAQLAEEMPGDFFQQLTFMWIGALIGVSMGLAISAFSNTQEQANTIVPLALIPQLILAGVLVPALPELGVWFSKATISAFWMTEGMTDIYIQNSDPAPQLINGATGEPEPLEAESSQLALVMLAVHLGGCLSAAIGLALFRFTQRQ